MNAVAWPMAVAREPACRRRCRPRASTAAKPLPPSPARLFVDGTERAVLLRGLRGRRAMDPRRAAWTTTTACAAHPAARVDGRRRGPGRLGSRGRPRRARARRSRADARSTLLTDGMRCAACAWLIDRALTREPGVLEVSANAVTGRIRIAWDPARTTLSRPLHRLLALGYRPYLATGAARERARRSERNRWLLRLGIAGLGAMQAMMFAEALYLGSIRGLGAMSRADARLPALDHLPGLHAGRVLFRLAVPVRRAARTARATRRAWTRWSRRRRCWPMAPASSKRCAAVRTSGTTRR